MTANERSLPQSFYVLWCMATTPPVTSDKAESARWQLQATNGFVIRDWTGIAPGGDPVILVLKATDIFDYMADAAQRKSKIAIYAIGPCLLDWSA